MNNQNPGMGFGNMGGNSARESAADFFHKR